MVVDLWLDEERGSRVGDGGPAVHDDKEEKKMEGGSELVGRELAQGMLPRGV